MSSSRSSHAPLLVMIIMAIVFLLAGAILLPSVHGATTSKTAYESAQLEAVQAVNLLSPATGGGYQEYQVPPGVHSYFSNTDHAGTEYALPVTVVGRAYVICVQATTNPTSTRTITCPPLSTIETWTSGSF